MVNEGCPAMLQHNKDYLKRYEVMIAVADPAMHGSLQVRPQAMAHDSRIIVGRTAHQPGCDFTY